MHQRELILNDVSAAKEWLEVVKSKSHNYLKDYSEMNDMEVKMYAVKTMDEVFDSLEIADELKEANQIH